MNTKDKCEKSFCLRNTDETDRSLIVDNYHMANFGSLNVKQKGSAAISFKDSWANIN